MPHDILPEVRGWRVAAGLAVLFPLLQADALAPDVLRLARIREKARSGLSSVPAYTCQESMVRSERTNRRAFFQKLDELKLDVAEIGGKELFSRFGESKFQDKPLTEMVTRGLISTGMFYQITGVVITGSAAQFVFGGRKKLKGRRAVEYNFKVASLFAVYRLQFNGYGAYCGMRGSLTADEDSLDLIRLHVEATDVPPQLRVRSAVTDIDYSRASIEGKSFLIPASSDVVLTMENGAEDRNQVRFSNCRKYGVESILSFQ